MRIKIEYEFSKRILKTHLVDHYYQLCGSETPEESIEKTEKYKKELESLKKKDSLLILKSGLKLYGIQGVYSDGFFEASYELGNEREWWGVEVEKWINKNYPNLP